MLEFATYMPESWLKDGVGYGSVEEPRHQAPVARSAAIFGDAFAAPKWFVSLAVASIVGLSAVIADLPVRAGEGASSLPAVLPVTAAPAFDRLALLQSALDTGEALPFAPELIERAKLIAARPKVDVDIDEWAA